MNERRREWLHLALSGQDDLDLAAARSALERLYRLAGKPAPRHLAIADSPLAALSAALALARVLGPQRRGLPESITPQLALFSRELKGEQRADWVLLEQSLSRLVESSVRSFVIAFGRENLRDGPALLDPLLQQLPFLRGVSTELPFYEPLRYEASPARRWKPSWGPRPVQIRPYGRWPGQEAAWSALGCGNPGWLAWGQALPDAGPVWEAACLLARSGVWDCLLHDHCALVVRRPQLVRRDDQGRLHGGAAPAFRWRDGFHGYAVHGVSVPESLATRPLSIDAIRELENVEVRRVLIDLYGRQRFLTEGGAETLEQDLDASGMPRSLLRLEESLYVQVTCPSTGHLHLLRVPGEIKSCAEAVAWTFGMSASDYAPLREA